MDRSAKTFVMTSLLLWVAVLGGCSRYLSDAQDHFSRAAAEETRLFGAGLAADGGLVRQTSAATDYRLALDLLDRELSENEGRLRDERLYGTALMLKALCLWRLADLDAAGAGPLADELAASLATIRAEQRRTRSPWASATGPCSSPCQDCATMTGACGPRTTQPPGGTSRAPWGCSTGP